MTIRILNNTVIRWTARLLGALLIGLIILFAVGEGVSLRDLNVVTGSMMIALLLSLTGMLMLWRWELGGGIMVLVGMSCFYAIDYLASGCIPGGGVLPVCFVPGILALASWLIEKTDHGRDLPSRSN